MKLIDKAAVSELKNLYEDIDKCIGDLVLARSKQDKRGVFDAHWKMVTLMVNTQQVLSYILQHLEVKEVVLDFEKELYKAFGQVKDFTLGMHIAKYFFELGLEAQKGE